MNVMYLAVLFIFVLTPSMSAAQDLGLPHPIGNPAQGTTRSLEPVTAPASSRTKKKKVADEHKKGPDRKSEASSLHRVEFVITGTECPVCLHRMELKMKKVAGVKKAAISRFSVTNYGAVIYDADLARWDDIVKSISDEKVGFDGVKDVVITKEEARSLIAPGEAVK